MTIRFRTLPHKGWSPLDPIWLSHVQSKARFCWVRFVGLNERAGIHPASNDRNVLKWEQAACKFTGRFMGKFPSAYLWVYFRRSHLANPKLPNTGWNPAQQTIDFSEACRKRWHVHAPIAGEIRRIMHQLRQQTPCRLGIFAEDFSARWLMESGFVADLTILDTPMVSIGEARDSALLKGEVHVRSAWWPQMDRYDRWGLPFPESELLPGTPSHKRHGLWDREDVE